MLDQEDWRRNDVDENGGEVERHRPGQRQEGRRRQHPRIRAQQVTRFQRLALFRGQRLRQPPPANQPGTASKKHQESEDRTPAEPHMQPAADHRGHGRRHREHQCHLRHQALRLGPFEHVAHDRPADDHAGAGRHALQRPKHQQALDVPGHRTPQGHQIEQGQNRQRHPPSPQGVGNRSMPQRHDGKGHHVGGQRLLHQQRRGVENASDLRHRRQVGIDRKWPDRRQCGQHRGKTASSAGGRWRGSGHGNSAS